MITPLYGIIKFTWDQGSNFATFWDQGSKFGAKNWDQRGKNIPGYDPAHLFALSPRSEHQKQAVISTEHLDITNVGFFVLLGSFAVGGSNN